MMQLKAIFSVLLREYEFELTQPPETYRNDHSKMVVQLAQPCAARMTPDDHARALSTDAVPRTERWSCMTGGGSWSTGTCARGTGSARPRRPTVFAVSKDGVLTVLDETPPDGRARARSRPP